MLFLLNYSLYYMNLADFFIEKKDQPFSVEQIKEILAGLESFTFFIFQQEDSNVIHSNLDSQQSESSNQAFDNEKSCQKTSEVQPRKPSFSKIQFSDQQGNRFFEYLKEIERHQEFQDDKRKAIYLKKQKQPIYKLENKYQRDVLNCCGVEIQVIYKPAENHWGTCLILPYQNFSFCQINRITRNEDLTMAILEKYNENYFKPGQKLNQILAFYCEKIIGCQDYKYIYLAQKYFTETETNNSQLSAKKLYEMIQNVIKKTERHRNTKNIVFPDFKWPGLNSFDTSRRVLEYIALVLHQLPEKKKVRNISICCSKKKSYLHYRHWIRWFIDSYWKKGLISLTKHHPKTIIRKQNLQKLHRYLSDETRQQNCTDEQRRKWRLTNSIIGN